jgi:mannosyltransferase
MACLVVLLADRLLSRRAAIWAGVVAALIPGLSWSGLEGRSYAWAAALAVLATYVLVLARENGGAVRWTAYAVVVALMIWWSLFAGLMLLVQGVALIIAERRLVLPWMLASGAATLACLPLVGLARSQSGQISWIQQPPMKVLSNVALRQVLLGSGRNSPGVALYEIAAVGLGLVVLVSVVGWLRSRERPRNPLAVPLVLLWATMPTLIVAGANLLGVQIYQSRYLTFTTPAIAIAVGAGLAAVSLRPRVALAVVGCLLMTPILLAQRAEDAKAGDDYLRLARLARDSHADLVVFDSAELRGIKIAYPEMFRGVHDASLAEPPRPTQSLWGRNVKPRQLKRHELAGRSVVFYQLSKPAPVRFTRALRRLGCEASPARVRTHRSDAVVLHC